MGVIVAIGGGDNGWGNSKYETGPADRLITELTKKMRPILLFIGFAAKDPEEYFRIIRDIYEKYNCDCVHLDEDSCKKGRAQEFVDQSDIIYVGGGNTYRLMCKIRRFGLDRILTEACCNGSNKVFCGVSAGAIIWSAYGNSATRSKNGTFTPVCVTGLGIIDVLYCPHVSRDGFRTESTRKMLKRKPGKIGLEVDFAAIVVYEDCYDIIALDERAVARKCYWKKGLYYKKQLLLGKCTPIADLYDLDGEVQIDDSCRN